MPSSSPAPATDAIDRVARARSRPYVGTMTEALHATDRAVLRIAGPEARDFLHDLIADLVDLHEDLGENPAIWTLQARFPRVP